jgi:signal transduction histidine kinase
VRLAQRLTLTFVGITLLLIAPSLYGVWSLRQLREVAQTLSARDAVGALALGRLQAAFRDVQSGQRVYIALAGDPADLPRQEQIIDESMGRVERELSTLRAGGYDAEVGVAERAWREVRVAVSESQELVEAGSLTAADAHRVQVLEPAFTRMENALQPIGEAINLAGQDAIRQAQAIAARASTTTVSALIGALLVAVLIGFWMGHSLLRPVGELRQGMARVAEGDFDQELHVANRRPDEIGDLARSFTTMAQDLAALDRMKAEFVSVASHELKTPLSVIRGYVSLLHDGIYGEMSPKQKKILSSVGDQTDRLGRLIQQLLDVSRFEAGVGRLDCKPFDLHAFLDEFAVSFEALAVQNEIDFEVSLEPDLPNVVVGDSDRLNEVVGNLLANAFKFTPRQGQIRLRAAAAAEDDALVIEVADTGPGIPQDELTRIFEKFYQVENPTHPKSLGTGLGLAISKEITEAHGGTITADSVVGEGTTFRLFLPVNPPGYQPVQRELSSSQ